MIRKDWKLLPFSEVAEYKAGRTPSRAAHKYWDTSLASVPWVAISDMENFGTVSVTKERITPAALTEVFRGQLAPAGTLLMSFKLTIGRVARLGIDACHNEAIISIYPKEGVDSEYLEYFLSQVDYASLQDRQVKGHTLNQEKIDRIQVLLPPLSEQRVIASTLAKVRRAVALNDQKGIVLEQLFDAVRHRLIDGILDRNSIDLEVVD